MLTIREKRTSPLGQVWYTQVDRQKWQWLFTVLPYLILHDDLGLVPVPALQEQSDLDLKTLPTYACKVPEAIFYPYITYITDDAFFNGDYGPTFTIPHTPWDRLSGRNLLTMLSSDSLALVNNSPNQQGIRLGWINPDDSLYTSWRGWPMENLEVIRRAKAAQFSFLDDLLDVYDESRDKTAPRIIAPRRHEFNQDIAASKSTQEYLEWYIQCFGSFFDKLVELGKLSNREAREKCMLAGWTINRLAIDLIIISRLDIPYIRKWQFFGSLDAIAGLLKILGDTRGETDIWKSMLTRPFFD